MKTLNTEVAVEKLASGIAGQIKAKKLNGVVLNSTISTQTPAQPVVDVVDAVKYAETMNNPLIYKQYCLKEKVTLPRIKRILLAMKEELGSIDIATAVAKYQTVKKEAGSLVKAIALKLGMSESTIAEELSEVTCHRNRNAMVTFVHSSLHHLLDIGEVCYYTGTRNKFIKAVNAQNAQAPSVSAPVTK